MMQLFTIHNLTSERLLIQTADDGYKSMLASLSPSTFTSLQFNDKLWRSALILSGDKHQEQTQVVKLDRFRTLMGVSWNLVSKKGPWKVYRSTVRLQIIFQPEDNSF